MFRSLPVSLAYHAGVGGGLAVLAAMAYATQDLAIFQRRFPAKSAGQNVVVFRFSGLQFRMALLATAIGTKRGCGLYLAGEFGACHWLFNAACASLAQLEQINFDS